MQIRESKNTIMTPVTLDHDAIRKTLLAELQRQGVEFAKIEIKENYTWELHVTIETYTEDILHHPKFIESARITNQLKSE